MTILTASGNVTIPGLVSSTICSALSSSGAASADARPKAHSSLQPKEKTLPLAVKQMLCIPPATIWMNSSAFTSSRPADFRLAGENRAGFERSKMSGPKPSCPVSPTPKVRTIPEIANLFACLAAISECVDVSAPTSTEAIINNF